MNAVYSRAMNNNRSKLRRGLVVRLVAGLFLVLSLGGCELFPWIGQSRVLTAQTQIIDSNGNTYSVGFDQVTGIRQDPFVRKVDSGGQEVWRIRHDQTSVDARAVSVALDGNDVPYVLFSTDGGSNDSGRIQLNHVQGQPFNGAPFPSYGPGGGGKVSIVARLDPENGRITAGTFLIARLGNGNTNSFQPEALAVSGTTVWVQARSSAWPPAAGARSGGGWIRFDPERFNDETRSGGNDRFQVLLPLDLTELLAVRWLDQNE
ncbi:MAG: hypothetical protein EA383_01515 [Spirochaetaceae bacterium]|nr:MAG: hypothetical protein EA383_01515 [Spirochaetaceae bacterium]